MKIKIQHIKIVNAVKTVHRGKFIALKTPVFQILIINELWLWSSLNSVFKVGIML